MHFNELGLSPELLQAITDTGYTTPTPIQQQAIPVVASGRDVLGCAQTGTGKTASFALPMIDKLAAGRSRARMPRSLILEPTRELATQVEAAFERYGKHHRLSTALLIGGESFGDQLKKLDRGVDVLIATPGRMLDLFERGKILLSDVRILVIDEADRMLDMGFIPDVERIVGLLPKTRQTLFFSATMPPEIRRLAGAFLNEPGALSVGPGPLLCTPARLAGGNRCAIDRRRCAGRQARGAAPPDRQRGRQERADLLQPQARCRHPAALALPPWVRCGGAAWRYVAAEADRNIGALQEERDPAARRQRRRGARARHPGSVARLLLRCALPRRRLCASHRPHRPRRPAGPLLHAGRAGGRQGRRRDPEADRQGHPGRQHRRFQPGRTRFQRRRPSSRQRPPGAERP